MRAYWMAAAAAAACCAGGALAQTGASDRVLRSFADCRQVAQPEARLACFDKAASSLEAAVKAKDVTIVDRQEIRKARRSLFGFTLPKIGLFGGHDDPTAEKPEEAFTEINTTVAAARTIANERAEIRLADDNGPGSGAVWQTTEPLPFLPRPGTKIRIRQGALGNYFLAIAGNRSVRGMRLR